MSNTINADDGIISGIAGLKYSADTSGALVLQTNGTTAITISASQVVTFAGAVSLGALTTSGNLTFTTAGSRIIGDMSNGTFASRLAFQTSTANSATTVYAIPNGTSTTSGFIASSDPSVANGSEIRLIVNGTTTNLTSSFRGSGATLPLAFDVGSERMRINTSGQIGIGTGSGITSTSLLDVAGVITANNGSASTPSISSRGETNAGLFFGDDTVASWVGLAAGGAEVMRVIGQSARVAIGATTASSKLYVYAADGAYQLGVAGTTKGVRFQSNSGSMTIQGVDSTLSGSYQPLTIGGLSLAFQTNGTTTAMTIDSSQNVGIGTSSPQYKLDISGVLRSTTSAATAYSTSVFENSASNGYVQQYFSIGAGGANGIATISYAPGIFFAMGPAQNDTNSPIVFRNNNATERMRIDSSGRVGIGTTTPGAKLVTTGAIQIQVGDFPTTGNGLEFNFTGGNTGYIQGYDRGTSTWRNINFGGASLIFETSGSEKMRLDSSGNLFVGGTTQNTATNPVYSKNTAKAFVYFSASGGSVSGVTGFNVSSVSRTGTGVFQVNYTTALASANYANLAVTGTGSPGSGDNAGGIRMYQGTTTYGYFATGTSGFGAFQDNAYNSFIAFA